MLFLSGRATSEAQDSAPQADQDLSISEKADTYHSQINQRIINSAQWLDSFFRTENYIAEENETRLQLRLAAFREKDEDTEFNARFNLKLNIPGTEQRLQLILGADPETAQVLDDAPTDAVRDLADKGEDNSTAALGYSFLDSEKHNLKMTGGVRLRDGNIVGFAGPRYRYYGELGRWGMRFEERLRWHTDDGWDSRSRIDFERPIHPRLFARLTPEISWFQDEDGVYYAFKTSLFHTISKKIAIEYQFNNYFYTELDDHLEESNLRLRYRQQIWREWLTLEVAPQLAWYEESDFDTKPGILVRFELWFGKWENEK